MGYSADDKVKIVTAQFKQIDEIIVEIKSLSDKKFYKEIAVPALYSILERMAWLRYKHEPTDSGKRLKKLLLTYPDQATVLKKIDLAFLYKWDISEHRETPKYKKRIEAIHSKLKPVLTELYGSIDADMQDRFIDFEILHQALLDKGFCGNCLENLRLFSVYEVIYLFGRCKAIHEGEFISVGFISAPLLTTIAESIAKNLKTACIIEKKLANEL